jgi:hypothetical protein
MASRYSLATVTDRDHFSFDRRRALLAGYLLLLAALVAGSTIREVGDGNEYFDMMQDLAAFERPSRYAHFWFYPALAVPFLPLVQVMSLDPFAAFVPVNVLLIGAAFWIASAVLAPTALLLLFASPIVWWTDKAHSEVFTFSLLTIALVAMRPSEGGRRLHPGWAVLCLAAAGAQNPPFLVLAPVAAALLVAMKVVSARERRFLRFCAVSLVLSILHPAYSYWRQGRATGLSVATHGQIPNIDEVLAVVRDSNIGLIANAPFLAVSVVLVIALCAIRSRRGLIAPDVLCALAAAGLFLVSFSLTNNYNHGATPSMSRYALWLIPLAVPFLRQVREIAPPAAISWPLSALAIGSCLWSLAMFHPERSESRPVTWLANWLWTNHPSLDRPLPEVFVERLRGADREWWLPVPTLGCTKILLNGRGDQPVWPIPCFPTALPPECRERTAFCYANLRGLTYEFQRVPTPSLPRYRFRPDAAWTVEESRTASQLLIRLRWWELPLCNISENRIRLGEFGVAGSHYYCGADRMLAYFKNRDGASIRARLRSQMAGAFIDASTGQVVGLVSYDGKPAELWELPIPPGPSSVFLVLTASGSF